MKKDMVNGIAVGLVVLVAASAVVRGADATVLFDFGSGFDVGSVARNDAKASLTAGGALRVETGRAEQWPGVTLKAPGGKWDLARCEYVSLDVKNLGDKFLTLSCRIDNPGADGSKNCVTDSMTLDAKAAGTLVVRLAPGALVLSEPLELIGMRGYPTHERKVDPANITQLLFFVTQPAADHVFEIDNIFAAGSMQTVDAKTFIPFIDEFGQFMHRDWPGKTHSVGELVDGRKTENEDIAAHPGPADRNQYGGWTAGPKLKATGAFRVEKFNGKWWLIDPEGRLFWSHGIDCVGSGNATPITDRRDYYAKLPNANSPLARFYGTGS